MKKWLIISILVLVGAAVSWSAAAQDCWKYHNVKLDYRSGTYVDPGDYDFCLWGIKASGTLNGELRICWYDADFIPSDQIYLGDDFPQIGAQKYYSRFLTRNGDIELREWSWFDGDFGLETGFSKVLGGTGDFENAIGTLSWTPRYPNLGPVNWMEGYICTP